MAFNFSKLTSAFKKEFVKTDRNSVIGVDVGSTAIKIVQLQNKKGVPTLDTYGELQLGPYGGTDIGKTTYLKIDTLTKAFIDIIREADASSRNVALAISFNSSFITNISVPKSEMENIEAIIPVEARKYVPMSLNELSLDWFPISTSDEEETQKILLAAIQNDALKKLRMMAGSAKLNERLVEIEVFSSIRSSVERKDGVVAVVDLGAGSTKLYIAENGVVKKTHGLRMNGTELTKILSSTLEIEFSEAEEIKRRDGLLSTESNSKTQKALSSMLERGFKEISTVLKRYAEDEKIEVEKMILCGSGAILKGLKEYVRDVVGKKVVIADPFSKVAYPTFLEDTLKEVGPAFTVAVGVALRGTAQE